MLDHRFTAQRDRTAARILAWPGARPSPPCTRNLLLVGTALGCSIALLAASPGTAWAADECGADVGGVAVCTATSGTGNPYPSGIDYFGDFGEDITVVLTGGAPATAVDVVTVGYDGVIAVTLYAGFNTSIIAYAGSSVDSTEDGMDALNFSSFGDATINTAATIDAGARGAYAYAGFGDATVINSGDISVNGADSAANYAIGIRVDAGNGLATVDSSGDLYVYGSSTDVYVHGVYAVGYTVDVDSSGDITVNADNASVAAGINVSGGQFYDTVTAADIDNSGAISVSNGGSGVTAGIGVALAGGDVYDATVYSSGDIDVVGNGNVFGIYVDALNYAEVEVVANIDVQADDPAYNNTGIWAFGFSGTGVSMTGDIMVDDGFEATGIYAGSAYDVDVSVTGNIQVGDAPGTDDAGYSNGVLAISSFGDVAVQADGNIAAYGYFTAGGVSAFAGTGDINIEVEGNLTAIAEIGQASGVYAEATGGEVEVDVLGVIYVDAAGDAWGVMAEADDLASVDIVGDVTAQSTGGDAYGVLASSSNDFAIVSVYGDLDVSADGSAFGAMAESPDGSEVQVTGNVTVESYNGPAQGLHAYSELGNAGVEVTGNVGVNAEDAAVGVYVVAAGGSGNAVVEGDVIVDSNSAAASGVTVSGGNSVDGQAIVVVTGDVSVSAGGGDAEGVIADGWTYALTYVTGDTSVTSATGDVFGIGALSDTGDATVLVVGSVDVQGDAFATGVFAHAGGEASVQIDEDVSAFSDDGVAFGVYAHAGNGDANVTVDGDISAYGDDDAFGVYAYSALGAVEVSVNNVYVTTDPLLGGGAGVYVYAETDATVTATGLISTTGIDVEGVDVIAALGDVAVSVNDVTTAGANSGGVEALALNGDVEITAYGYVTTGGDFADGLNGYAVDGDADINNLGIVTTSGDGARGMVATSVDGDANADNLGDVDTSGDDAIGVFVASVNGDAIAFSEGSVTTSGDDSYGIAAYSAAGAVAITNDGEVYTSGDHSHGLAAYAAAGTAFVDNSDGHIETTGDYSFGIYAHGDAGVTITNGDYSVFTSGYGAIGIFGYSANGPVQIYSGVVTTSGDGAIGISAESQGGDPADYVSIYSFLTTTSGDGAHGISAETLSGDISIDSIDVETGGDNASGILAVSAYGDIEIDSDFVLTLGSSSIGIDAQALNGAVDVQSLNVFTEGDSAIGIDALAQSDAYVTSEYVTTEGAFATGVLAHSYFGTATVNSFSVDTAGDDAAGIFAQGFAGGYVTSTFVETHGDYANGIMAFSTGGNLASVDSFDVVTHGDHSAGIVAIGAAYYDSGAGEAYAGDVDVDSGTIITYGDQSFGIYAQAQGGEVIVGSDTILTYGAGAVGLYAAALACHDPGLLLNLHGDVDVTADLVRTEGVDAHGVRAYAEGGTVVVDVGEVRTAGDSAYGVFAFAAYYFDAALSTGYSGDVFVTADDIRTYGFDADGIVAYATGGEVQVVAGDVFAFGAASDAIYAGTGGFDGSNSDEVTVITTGSVSALDGRGVYVSSSSSSNIYVTSGSVTGSAWGIQSSSQDGTYIFNGGYIGGGSGRAIDVDGAAAVLQNDGVLRGFVDFTEFADHVENDGLWFASGTSSFGGGTDDVDNDGTLNFDRYTGAAATTTFTGLEFFDNTGLVSGYDNQVGDVLAMPGTTFTGAGASTLVLDVQLGGPGSAADRLVIGSAAGVTAVVPNDILAASPGVVNLGGILVVDSANAAEVGSEFTMADIDKGLVTYSLYFDAANDDWLIVGLPDDEAFETMGAMSASEDFASRSSAAMSARWEDTRDSGSSGDAAAGPGGSGRSDGWELWMQAHAGDEGFDSLQSFDIGGFTFAQDLSTDTDWRGFQFGFDNLSGDTLWGLTMGFNQQETRFDATSNSFDIEGWNLGAYAGWSANGLFANVLVKGDFFEVDSSFHTLPAQFSFDGTAWGVKGELGYRWEGEQLFFESIASLAWTTTRLDSVTTLGATIDFHDADSLIGRAGARVGGTFGSGAVVLTPFVGLYAVEELDGDNQLDFTTGGTTITLKDEARDGFGQVDFGVSVQTFHGLEGFVKGELNFGGDADGGSGRVGVRWRW